MYVVKAETIHRLCSLTEFFTSDVPDTVKSLINTVRVENRGGQTFVVATNSKIAAVEYAGQTQQPDSSIHLKVNKMVSERMREAGKIGTIMTIQTVPEIAVSTMQGDDGNTLTDVCHWFDYTPLDNWRDWFIKPADKPEAFMQWDLFQVESLLRSSPTGKIAFPKTINANKPVILRDCGNSNWMGCFIPNPVKGVEPATLPDWF